LASVTLEAPIGILALAANPATNLLYAGVYDGVQIVDLESLQVVAKLTKDCYVTLAADPVRGGFCVGHYDASSNTHYLAYYAAFGQEELGRTPLGGDPRGAVVNPEDGRIYVANSWSNDVTVIDGITMRTVATVPTGLRPLGVAIGQGGLVYVVNEESENVGVVDGNTRGLVATVAVSPSPRGMAIEAQSGRLYVAGASTNSVFVIEGQRVIEEIPVGLHPTEVALSPDGTELLVLNHVGGDLLHLSVQDHRVLEKTSLGSMPQGLAMAPQAGQLYVSDLVLDADGQRLLRRTELATIYGSTVTPVRIQVDSTGGRAYFIASNGVPGSNSGLIVYVVDMRTGQLVEGEVGGLSMTGLALDPAGRRTFSTAGRFGQYQLIVNDLDTLERVAAMPLPMYPAALAYNPRTQHIFICLIRDSYQAAGRGVEVWVLDSRGLGVVTRIPIPGKPDPWDLYELAVDSARGYVYLSDAHRGTVHVMRDVLLPPPPTPAPTDTPTPWPTLTPEPVPAHSVVPTEQRCDPAPHALFEPFWSGDDSVRLRLGCPIQELQDGFMAEQVFERGNMLWREADRSVFVLYDDGHWLSLVDAWTEGMPEYSCTASAPQNLLEPRRGFGLVWCSQQGVKEGLGWAIAEEVGHANSWQAFEGGVMIASSARAVVYALIDDGTFVEYPTQ
jgi:YVTN family beta-propeller protein